YSLMFSLPGTPVLRYGDEIGMGDDLELAERNSIRTPMQWCDEDQGGFSTAQKTILPVIRGGPYGYEIINDEAQRRDPNSLLKWFERIIRLRKECPEFGWGTCKILKTREPAVLAIRYDWRKNALLTLHNFSDKPKSLKLDCGPESKRLMNTGVGEHSNAHPDGQHRIVLEGYGYRWFRVGGLDYILKRQKY